MEAAAIDLEGRWSSVVVLAGEGDDKGCAGQEEGAGDVPAEDRLGIERRDQPEHGAACFQRHHREGSGEAEPEAGAGGEGAAERAVGELQKDWLEEDPVQEDGVHAEVESEHRVLLEAQLITGCVYLWN